MIQVYLHPALIAGENDSIDQAHQWCQAVESAGDLKVNLISYNPPPGDSHRPATDSRIEEIAEVTRQYFTTQVVARVGYDVKASCGMFVEGPK